MVFCGECGAAMVGNSGSYKTSSGKIRYSYYECNKRDRKKTCENPRIRKEILEEKVLERLHSQIFSPEKLSLIAAKVNEYNKSASKEVLDEIEYLKNEQKENRKQIDNIVSAIANGANFESLKEKLSELENKKTRLAARLEEAAALSRRSQISE